jgi:hypothetical protein
MKRMKHLFGNLFLTTFLVATVHYAFAFHSSSKIPLSAAVRLGGAQPGSTQLTIPQVLDPQVFFSKDVAIPLVITQGGASSSPALRSGSFNAAPALLGVTVEMLYETRNLDNTVRVPAISVPVSFVQVPGNTNQYRGTAAVPSQRLSSIARDGLLAYWFRVTPIGQPAVIYDKSGTPHSEGTLDPYITEIKDTMQFGTLSPLGSFVTLPDTNLTDGKTTLSFPPGALSQPGTLVVRAKDPALLPSGPGGRSPIIAYDFSLNGTSLLREVVITLSYPARPDGTVGAQLGSPDSLAPYWLSTGFNWIVMGPRHLDPTLHTVSMTSPHFSTFALFLSGATSAADLARSIPRIITPNGDGHNDTADFSSINTDDGVHLYDAKGRRVRTLSGVGSALIWSGTDDEGRIVESGVYIYQFTVNGERVSGVILVAK